MGPHHNIGPVFDESFSVILLNLAFISLTERSLLRDFQYWQSFFFRTFNLIFKKLLGYFRKYNINMHASSTRYYRMPQKCIKLFYLPVLCSKTKLFVSSSHDNMIFFIGWWFRNILHCPCILCGCSKYFLDTKHVSHCSFFSCLDKLNLKNRIWGSWIFELYCKI